MLTIKKFGVKSLTNAEAYGFLCGARVALQEAFKVLPDYAARFIETMVVFDAAMQPKEGGITGKELDVLDAKVDELWSNMRAFLRAMVNHPEAQVEAAAELCQSVFEAIEEPTRKPYSAQYPLMLRLVESLEDLGEEVLKASQLLPWLTALKSAISDFMTLYELRMDEKAKKELGIVKTARLNATDAYRLLVRAVNVHLELTHDPEHEAFTKNLNTRINTQQSLQKGRRTAAARKEKERAE